MADTRRKVMAGVMTLAAVTGLALTSTPASAATASVKLKVCQANSRPGAQINNASVSGNNQNGIYSHSYTFSITKYKQCVTVNNYWWQVGQLVDVSYTDEKGTAYGWPFYPSGKNGSTYEVDINNNGL